MCGITGFIDYTDRISDHDLDRMRDSLIHRGPDDYGSELFHGPIFKAGLAHRRLSIIDLSPAGHQPMSFDHLTIVFNGEIYNFLEIKNFLISKGYNFKSNSDTEVILKAFHLEGPKCVDRFRGMFAFAIFDKKTSELFLFRDRAGVKPLYYSFNGSSFIFSSELKSFFQLDFYKRDLNQGSIFQYLKYGFIPAPLSIFNNTFKLLPGYYLVFNCLSKNLSLEKYWSSRDYYSLPKSSISYEKATTELEEILTESFMLRMVSDVPVGVFLSSGVDSTLVASILQSNLSTKLNTFTIGFPDWENNEAPFAKKIAEYLGTNHTELYCTSDLARETLFSLPSFFDEPFADSSAIPTYLVSKLSREFVTVALSADGGDESFAGYNRYKNIVHTIELLSKSPQILNKLSSKLSSLSSYTLSLLKISNLINLRKLDKFSLVSGNYSPENVSDVFLQNTLESDALLFLKSEVENINLVNIKNFSLSATDNLSRIQCFDYETYLPDDVLTKIDRTSMAVSLESREPLLDHKIIEYAATLPDKYKFDGNSSKIILRSILSKYLPPEYISRKKLGFGVDILSWFRPVIIELSETFLSRERLKTEGIFNPDEVLSLLSKYKNKPQFITGNTLWYILMFQMWYSKWMK